MKLIWGTMEWKRERSRYFNRAQILMMIMMEIIMMIMMTIVMSKMIIIRICLLEFFLFSPVSITGCQPVCTRARL